MPNQFLSDEFGDIEDYFVTDYRLIDNFVGDQLWVWGFNNNGQLGVNDTTRRSTPITTFAGGTDWKSVACDSGGHTAAIKTDGTLWNWGFNINGHLGTNDTTRRLTPVTTFAGGTDWKQIACAGTSFGGHTAAIKTDGSLWVWGAGANGALGTNSTASSITPVTTFAGGNNWKSVACGRINDGGYTVAIKTDGTLWIWGRSVEGQLGANLIGAAQERRTPVTTFAGGTDWKSVAAKGAHTLAIKTDGTLWVWGQNTQGRLGTNDITDRATPVTTFAGGNNWKSVACGLNHSAAIKTDGSLWTWGGNAVGELGDNSIITRSTPVTTFVGGNNWKYVAAGNNNTVAIKTDGTLWSWGSNDNGTLGINLSGATDRSTPVTTFAGGNNWKSADVGFYYTIAIKSGLNVDLS